MNNQPSRNGPKGRGKFQPQQLYKPGSGPLLRKSDSNKSLNNANFENDNQSFNRGYPSNKEFPDASDNNKSSVNGRLKRPEQNFYVPKSKPNFDDGSGGGGGRSMDYRPDQNHDSGYQNAPRDFRQASEPRNVSSIANPPNRNFIPNIDNQRIQRDTKSVEPNYQTKDRKPPMGSRRSSNTATGPIGDSNIIRLPANIESLPPRFQRKYLEDNGLSLDLLKFTTNSNSGNNSNNSNNSRMDTIPQRSQFTVSQHHQNQNKMQPNHNQQSSQYYNKPYNQNWSQTLPHPHRGGQRGRWSNNNNNNNYSHSRSQTPDLIPRPRSRSSDISYDECDQQRPSSRNSYYESSSSRGKNYNRNFNKNFNNNSNNHYNNQQKNPRRNDRNDWNDRNDRNEYNFSPPYKNEARNQHQPQSPNEVPLSPLVLDKEKIDISQFNWSDEVEADELNRRNNNNPDNMNYHQNQRRRNRRYVFLFIKPNIPNSLISMFVNIIVNFLLTNIIIII